MYDPKYDLPFTIGLSLAVSLIATYVTADNMLINAVDPFCPESIDSQEACETAARATSAEKLVSP